MFAPLLPKLSTAAALAFLVSAPVHAQLLPQAPPPAPPMISAGVPSLAQPDAPLVATQYSIGDPTAEEQQYLEYINRARANPPAEGERLANTTDASVRGIYNAFSVDLALMRSQFNVIPPQPPLAMNSLLLTTARAHSQNQLTLGYQGHGDFDGGPATIAERITASGYLIGSTGYSLAENVYAFSRTVFYGHAGFEVDWGGSPATGGMQSPPGHRNSIHSASYREIGIGAIYGTNGIIGPQVVTQEFGRRSEQAFITGVVYRDANNNGFYDIGEGIPNVRIDVTGANFFAISATAGGYTVPVPADGAYTVTFSGGGVTTTQRTATVANAQSVKVDFVSGGTNALESISTRAQVGLNDDVIIGGFAVRGAGAKRILIRGLGPILADYHVPNVLANPTLTVYRGQTVLATNDDWASASNVADIIATGKAPTKPLESTILLSLPEGDYTAIVRGTGANPTGAGLVQIYDLDPTSAPKLQSISTRSVVGAGDDVMIGGVNIVGTGVQKVVIRGIGPSLTQYGVPGALGNPTLRVTNLNGDTVAANDDWASGASAAELTTLGQSPSGATGALEAALVVNLNPGQYTAIVSGLNAATGVGLVQVFKID